MAYTKSPRPYKKEYAEYQGTEEQKKKRAQRNKARREAIREGRAHKGDGMDVHHLKAMSKGGKNKDGLKVVSAAENRSYDRNSKHGMVSEVSPRERKRK